MLFNLDMVVNISQDTWLSQLSPSGFNARHLILPSCCKSRFWARFIKPATDLGKTVQSMDENIHY